MCFPAKCGTCGQTTWAGCGKHVPSVFEKIPKGQACMCKSWPGVVFPDESATESKSEGNKPKDNKPKGDGTSAEAAAAKT